jgi:endonuclease YncB( thermonuclease family)
MGNQSLTRFIVAAGLALAVLNAHAEFTGKVIAVADGDTLTVLLDERQIRVRLLEIDAPEKAQAFGDRSKQSLSELCFGKPARLEGNTKDRYGRTLARVYCDGIDANAEQVRRGMAWVFDRYVTDRNLYGVQDEARQAKRGLWVDTEPVPPWEWRRAKADN